MSLVPSELIEKISQDKCAVYIGAGLSMGAGLPDWIKLIKNMIIWSETRNIPLLEKEELNSLIDNGDLLDVAEIIKSKMGAARFREYMAGVFRSHNLKPTESHKLLPEISFSQILTSNYDKLIESSYLLARDGVATPVFTQLDTTELSGALQSSEFHILKTHGDIDRIDSIILTRNQYRKLMNDNEAYKLYLQNVFTTKTVLFLGFSLTDPDLLTILDALQVHLNGITPQHFALMDGNKVSSLKAEQFRQNYNINIIRYTPSSISHPEVEEFLKELVEKTPKKHLRQLAELKKNLDDIDTHYKIVATTEGNFEIHEKFPGASNEKPLNISFKVIQDEETQDAIQRFFDTGEQLTINSQHIKDIALPELFTKLFNIDTSEVKIVAGPSKSKKIIKTRLILEPYDGESVVIEGIELVNISSGEKQAIVNNEHQDHIFRIKIILDFTYSDALHSYKAEVSITLDSRQFNLREQLLVDRYFYALSKGAKLYFENIENGKPIANPGFIKAENVPDHPKWIPILEALLLIQTATHTQFSVPKNLSNEVVKQILNVAYVIKHGIGKGDVKYSMDVDIQILKDLLDKEPTIDFSTYSEEQTVIQGKRVKLGISWITCNPILSEDEKLRLGKEIEKNPEQPRFLVKFASTAENQAITYYFDFLSPDDFENLHANPKYRKFALDYLIDTFVEAATHKNKNIDIHILLLCIESAAKEVNNYGKPYNMLPRATFDELKSAFKPHNFKLKNSQRSLLFSKLVELKIITEENTDLFTYEIV